MLYGVVRKTPEAEKGVSLLITNGNGFPPAIPRHGSSKPPAGLVRVSRLPQGDAAEEFSLHRRGRYSKLSAYDARMDMRPSPCGSQASPTLGLTSLNCLLTPVREGKPGSPE